MNARTMMMACLLTLPFVTTVAQQPEEPVEKTERAVVRSHGDTITILKGKGDMRIKLYEELPDGKQGETEEIYNGVFLERVDEEERSFLDALPMIPKKKGRKNSYEPHCSGVYIGFSRLSDGFAEFGASSGAHLDISKSWEFGFNLLCSHFHLSRDSHWGVNYGLNWGYRSYNIEGRRALIKYGEQAVFSDGSEHAGDEGYRSDVAYYDRSRLRHFFFQIPVTIEWQKRGDRSFFINAGPEFEIRHGVKSFSHVQGGKKECVGKGMYVRPVGVNLLMQAGYGSLGVYLRYSMNGFFQKDKGPELAPYSFGLAWYW